jgi:hypothetical protein
LIDKKLHKSREGGQEKLFYLESEIKQA